MKTIDTTIITVDLKGKPLPVSDGENLSYGEAIGNILISAKTGGPMKLFTLAMKMNKPKVEVDENDITLIKQSVEKAEIYSALVTGQILLYLENLKNNE